MDLCFMCTRDYNCLAVNKEIVSQVEYLLPEITIIRLGVPLRICSVCEGALFSFNQFKKSSLDTSRRLESRIKEANSFGAPNSLTVKTTSDSDLEEILSDEELEEKPSCKKQEPNLWKEERSNAEDEINEKQTSDSEEDEEEKSKTVKHKNERKFQCAICNRKFFKSHHLSKHMKTHSDQSYQCYICNRIFAHKGLLIDHTKRIHMDVREFPCRVCDKSFMNSCELRKHMKRHGLLPEFPCKVCNKKFTMYMNLRVHMRTHVTVKQKEYKCHLCSKIFHIKRNYNLHLENNTCRIMSFYCEICKKTFTQPGAVLARHGKSKEHTLNLMQRMQLKK